MRPKAATTLLLRRLVGQTAGDLRRRPKHCRPFLPSLLSPFSAAHIILSAQTRHCVHFVADIATSATRRRRLWSLLLAQLRGRAFTFESEQAVAWVRESGWSRSKESSACKSCHSAPHTHAHNALPFISALCALNWSWSLNEKSEALSSVCRVY